MKRSGFRRTGEPPPWKPRKPIPARSAKRVSEVDARRQVVAEVLARDAHACRAPARFAAAGIDDPVPCGGPLDGHELIRRSAWSGGYLVEANIVTICRRHHDWIGAYPAAAIDAGLALHSTAPRPTNPTKENR